MAPLLTSAQGRSWAGGERAWIERDLGKALDSRAPSGGLGRRYEYEGVATGVPAMTLRSVGTVPRACPTVDPYF